MKLLSLSKNSPAPAAEAATTTTLARPSSWPWQAYCHQPKTLSFHEGNDLFRSATSPSRCQKEEDDDDSEDREGDDSIETVIQGARSEGRLFFEPAGETSSVLAVESDDGSAGEGARAQELAAAEGVAMCVVESRDPYGDFRMSMEEMVEAHALRDRWDSLADLLRCYLRVNDRTNHEHILRAFIDLLVSSGPRRTGSAFTGGGSSCSRQCNDDTDNIVSSDADVNINPPSTTSSPCSPLSFYTSSSSCCSSSDSLSTTPCCISVTGDTQENGSGGGGGGGGSLSQGRLPLSLKVVVTEQHNGGDDSSSSTTTSSSSSSDPREIL